MSGDLKRKKIEDEDEWDISKIESCVEIGRVSAKRKEQLKVQRLEADQKERKEDENVTQMFTRIQQGPQQWVEDDYYKCKFDNNHAHPVYRPRGVHPVVVDDIQSLALCGKCLIDNVGFNYVVSSMKSNYTPYIAADALPEYARSIDCWRKTEKSLATHCRFYKTIRHSFSKTVIYRLDTFNLKGGYSLGLAPVMMCKNCLSDKARVEEFITETVNKVYSK